MSFNQIYQAFFKRNFSRYHGNGIRKIGFYSLSFRKTLISQERSGILTFCKKKNDKEMSLYNINTIFNFDLDGRKIG